jgi:selenocysteine-specific elongation factor
VRDEVTRRTAGTVLAEAPVVACDAVDRTGLDDVRRQLAEILTARPPRRTGHDRPRLWVDRSFTIAGAGTVVTGGVGHGTFVTGDRAEATGSDGTTPARVRGIEALGRRVGNAPPGTRAALNLAGIDRRVVRRGDAVVRPGEWHLTATVEATLAVLGSVDHEVTHRGAYLAYLGTGEHTVRLRLIGESSLIPEETGTVRLALGHALPLAPGDRYVLRETGRGEIVGGGELVDVDPPRRRSRRRSGPERQLVGEGEWVRADELERRLGVAVAPVVAGWVVSPGTLRSAHDALVERIDHARPVGLDVARLDERERAILTLLEGEQRATTIAGYAVDPAWRDELADHPLVRQLEEQLFTPPAPATGPEVLRALVRRGHVVVKDGVYFAARARVVAAAELAELSRHRPDGFTVGEAREALGTTRKWAVPLLQLLDEAGITSRHGDRRHVRPSPS